MNLILAHFGSIESNNLIYSKNNKKHIQLMIRGVQKRCVNVQRTTRQHYQGSCDTILRKSLRLPKVTSQDMNHRIKSFQVLLNI